MVLSWNIYFLLYVFLALGETMRDVVGAASSLSCRMLHTTCKYKLSRALKGGFTLHTFNCRRSKSAFAYFYFFWQSVQSQMNAATIKKEKKIIAGVLVWRFPRALVLNNSQWKTLDNLTFLYPKWLPQKQMITIHPQYNPLNYPTATIAICLAKKKREVQTERARESEWVSVGKVAEEQSG